MLLATTAANAVYPLDIDERRHGVLVMHSPGTGDADLAVRPIVAGNECPIAEVRPIREPTVPAPSGRRTSQLIFAKGRELRLARSDGSEARTWCRHPESRSRRGCRRRNASPLLGNDEKSGATTLRKRAPTGPAPAAAVVDGRGNPLRSWRTMGRYYLFEADGISVALPEAAGILRRTGEPVQLTVGPLRFRSVMPSRDGKRLFVVGDQERGTLARYDPASKQFVEYGPTTRLMAPTCLRTAPRWCTPPCRRDVVAEPSEWSQRQQPPSRR